MARKTNSEIDAGANILKYLGKDFYDEWKLTNAGRPKLPFDHISGSISFFPSQSGVIKIPSTINYRVQDSEYDCSISDSLSARVLLKRG